MSFYILGINLGAGPIDYCMLHNKLIFNNENTLETLLKKYNNSSATERLKIEEELFYLLDRGPSLKPFIKNKDLAHLIFEKGIDILEMYYHRDDFSYFITENQKILFNALNDKIKDSFGAHQFNKIYPNFSSFLNVTFNNFLPIHLQKKPKNLINIISEIFNYSYLKNLFSIKTFKRILKRIKNIFNNKIPIKYLGNSPLEKRFQKIKNKLCTSFFEKVISSTIKPSIISLQEVMNTNNQTLQILKNANYKIAGLEKSDTALAIDKNKFKTHAIYHLPEDTTAAYVESKETGETFIFASVHAPGYTLEIPKDSQKIHNHCLNVEASLENGSYSFIKNLKSNLHELKKMHPQASIVIQGDFNSYPEYFDNQLLTKKIKDLNIFNLLSNYTLFRTYQPTELNKNASSLQARELDYVFASTDIKERIQLFEPKKEELSLSSLYSISETKKKKIYFDPKLHFSDHTPIWAEIKK